MYRTIKTNKCALSDLTELTVLVLTALVKACLRVRSKIRLSTKGQSMRNYAAGSRDGIHRLH